MIGNTVQEIFEAMQGFMQKLLPGETDSSCQDPGETLLELFALLAHMQYDYINYIGTKHYKAYKRLLGMGVDKEERPLLACMLPEGDYLREHTVLYQGQRMAYVPAGFLFDGYQQGDYTAVRVDSVSIDDQHPLKLPFETAEPCLVSDNVLIQFLQKEDGLYLYFQSQLKTHPVGQLYLEMEKQGLRPENCEPLGKLTGESRSEDSQWEALSLLTDHTDCFLHSGYIELHTKKEMKESAEGYVVRLHINENQYQQIPGIRAVYLNLAAAMPGETISYYQRNEQNPFVEIPGFYVNSDFDVNWEKSRINLELQKEAESRAKANAEKLEYKSITVFFQKKYDKKIKFLTDGTVNQMIALQIESIIPNSLRILIHDTGLDQWKTWTRVENFHNSREGDPHYVLLDNKLFFGNGRIGAIPPVGEGFIIQCRSKYGQERKDRVEQTVSEAFYKPLKAVTVQDYEGFMKEMEQSSPDLAQSAVWMDEERDAIVILVRPVSSQPLPLLPRGYQQLILSRLEPYRMINTELRVEGPVYCGMTLVVQVSTSFENRDIDQEIAEMLLRSFPTKAFDTGVNRAFGETIYRKEITDLFYKMKGEKQIKSFTFQCEHAVSAQNLIKLPYNGLVYLKQIQVNEQS